MHYSIPRNKHSYINAKQQIYNIHEGTLNTYQLINSVLGEKVELEQIKINLLKPIKKMINVSEVYGLKNIEMIEDSHRFFSFKKKEIDNRRKLCKQHFIRKSLLKKAILEKCEEFKSGSDYINLNFTLDYSVIYRDDKIRYIFGMIYDFNYVSINLINSNIVQNIIFPIELLKLTHKNTIFLNIMKCHHEEMANFEINFSEISKITGLNKITLRIDACYIPNLKNSNFDLINKITKLEICINDYRHMKYLSPGIFGKNITTISNQQIDDIKLNKSVLLYCQ